MTTTQDWLEARRTALGASESPIILGQTTWGSQKEIQCRKLGLLPPGESSEYLDWRKKLEGPMTEHFLERREGWDCTRDPAMMLEVLDGEAAKCSMTAYTDAGELWCLSDAYPWLGCSPDALCWRNGQVGILEFKTAYSRDDWEEGVPGYYITQVIHQMLVTGLRRACVVVSFGGGSEPPEIYDLPWDQEYAEWVLKETAQWWDRHIKGEEEVPLDGSDAERKAIDALADPVEGREIEGGDEARAATQRILTLTERQKENEAAIKRLKAHIRDTMSSTGAERMVFPGGDAWTYKQNKRGTFSLRYVEAKP